MCCPLVVDSPVPFLDIRDGRHPCVSHTYSGDVFVPNDVVINGGRSQDGCLVVVVTGPNMGGKSTLIRQTGLIVILAQLVRTTKVCSLYLQYTHYYCGCGLMASLYQLHLVLPCLVVVYLCRVAMCRLAAVLSVLWTGSSPELEPLTELHQVILMNYS